MYIKNSIENVYRMYIKNRYCLAPCHTVTCDNHSIHSRMHTHIHSTLEVHLISIEYLVSTYLIKIF